MRKPDYRVFYNGSNFSAEFKRRIESLEYFFAQSGRADGFEMTVADPDLKFASTAYPSDGDEVDLDIGWSAPAKLLDCGSFFVDAPDFDLYERKVTFKGTSTEVKATLFEIRFAEYKETDLKSIISTIASRNGLNLKGTVASISITRKSQTGSDLDFLNELADMFGYIFKVDGGDLIFHKYGEIEKADPLFEIDSKNLLLGSRISDTKRQYQYCEISYHANGALIKKKVEDPSVKNGLTLKIQDRAENITQAEAIATAQLFRANRDAISGALVFPGTIEAAAGVVFKLKNYGRLSGIYCIRSGSHSIRSGVDAFTTSVEVYKI